LKTKDYNVTVVYTDGRTLSALNAKGTSKEDVFIRYLQLERDNGESVLSITVVEKQRLDY